MSYIDPCQGLQEYDDILACAEHIDVQLYRDTAAIPVIVPRDRLPTNTQTALNTCDNDTSCSVIGFDFVNDVHNCSNLPTRSRSPWNGVNNYEYRFSHGMYYDIPPQQISGSRTFEGISYPTYQNYTGSGSGCYCYMYAQQVDQFGNKIPSGNFWTLYKYQETQNYTPPTQRNAKYIVDTSQNEAADAGVFKKISVPDIPILKVPPGYFYLAIGINESDLQTTTITTTSNDPQTSSLNCAKICNSLPNCVGFNFKFIDTGCTFFSHIRTEAYGDPTFKNVAYLVNNDISQFTKNNWKYDNSKVFLQDTGTECLSAPQCNSNISQLIQSGVSSFSTEDIKACSACPVKTISQHHNIYHVQDELGHTTQYTSQADAIQHLQYNSTPNNANTQFVGANRGLTNNTIYNIRPLIKTPDAISNYTYIDNPICAGTVDIYDHCSTTSQPSSQPTIWPTVYYTNGRFYNLSFPLPGTRGVTEITPAFGITTDSNNEWTIEPVDYVTDGFRLKNKKTFKVLSTKDSNVHTCYNTFMNSINSANNPWKMTKQATITGDQFSFSGESPLCDSAQITFSNQISPQGTLINYQGYYDFNGTLGLGLGYEITSRPFPGNITGATFTYSCQQTRVIGTVFTSTTSLDGSRFFFTVRSTTEAPLDQLRSTLIIDGVTDLNGDPILFKGTYSNGSWNVQSKIKNVTVPQITLPAGTPFKTINTEYRTFSACMRDQFSGTDSFELTTSHNSFDNKYTHDYNQTVFVISKSNDTLINLLETTYPASNFMFQKPNKTKYTYERGNTTIKQLPNGVFSLFKKLYRQDAISFDSYCSPIKPIEFFSSPPGCGDCTEHSIADTPQYIDLLTDTTFWIVVNIPNSFEFNLSVISDTQNTLTPPVLTNCGFPNSPDCQTPYTLFAGSDFFPQAVISPRGESTTGIQTPGRILYTRDFNLRRWVMDYVYSIYLNPVTFSDTFLGGSESTLSCYADGTVTLDTAFSDTRTTGAFCSNDTDHLNDTLTQPARTMLVCSDFVSAEDFTTGLGVIRKYIQSLGENYVQFLYLKRNTEIINSNVNQINIHFPGIFSSPTFSSFIDPGINLTTAIQNALGQLSLGEAIFSYPYENTINQIRTSFYGPNGPWTFMKSLTERYTTQKTQNTDQFINFFGLALVLGVEACKIGINRIDTIATYYESRLNTIDPSKTQLTFLWNAINQIHTNKSLSLGYLGFVSYQGNSIGLNTNFERDYLVPSDYEKIWNLYYTTYSLFLILENQTVPDKEVQNALEDIKNRVTDIQTRGQSISTDKTFEIQRELEDLKNRITNTQPGAQGVSADKTFEIQRELEDLKNRITNTQPGAQGVSADKTFEIQRELEDLKNRITQTTPNFCGTAPPNGSYDSTCSLNCDAGYERVFNPATLQFRCFLCSPGFYSPGGKVACSPCAFCGSNQYRSGCGPSSPGTCTSCTVCSSGQYETTACSGTQNRVCSSCTTCSSGQYETTACSGTQNRVCSSCTTCSSTEYETTACSGTQNRVCSSCTVCVSGQYETTACSGTQNRVCSSCATLACTGDKYRSGCGPSSQGTCIPCTTCSSGQYEKSACSITQNRVCSSCTVCSSGQYETTACSGIQNRVCSSCTTCSSGQYETTACSGTQNRVCSSCTTCSSTEYETTACSGTQNRVCSSCSSLACSDVCAWFGIFKKCYPAYRSGCGNGSRGSCVRCSSCTAGKQIATACKANGDSTQNTVCTPQPCIFSGWTDWTTCSKGCMGLQYSYPNITQYAHKDSTAQCPDAVVQRCNVGDQYCWMYMTSGENWRGNRKGNFYFSSLFPNISPPSLITPSTPLPTGKDPYTTTVYKSDWLNMPVNDNDLRCLRLTNSGYTVKLYDGRGTGQSFPAYENYSDCLYWRDTSGSIYGNFWDTASSLTITLTDSPKTYRPVVYDNNGSLTCPTGTQSGNYCVV